MADLTCNPDLSGFLTWRVLKSRVFVFVAQADTKSDYQIQG